MLFGSRFPVALLHNLTDFATKIHFGREKPERANAPNIHEVDSSEELLPVAACGEKLLNCHNTLACPCSQYARNFVCLTLLV